MDEVVDCRALCSLSRGTTCSDLYNYGDWSLMCSCNLQAHQYDIQVDCHSQRYLQVPMVDPFVMAIADSINQLLEKPPALAFRQPSLGILRKSSNRNLIFLSESVRTRNNSRITWRKGEFLTILSNSSPPATCSSTM